jgi:hypothetical protein
MLLLFLFRFHSVTSFAFHSIATTCIDPQSPLLQSFATMEHVALAVVLLAVMALAQGSHMLALDAPSYPATVAQFTFPVGAELSSLSAATNTPEGFLSALSLICDALSLVCQLTVIRPLTNVPPPYIGAVEFCQIGSSSCTLEEFELIPSHLVCPYEIFEFSPANKLIEIPAPTLLELSHVRSRELTSLEYSVTSNPPRAFNASKAIFTAGAYEITILQLSVDSWQHPSVLPRCATKV